MAINLRKFETESEFSSAYTGDTYVEPWVSYVEETSGIMFNKVYLKRIEIKSLKMVGDVPASGGTVNKDNCTYIVNAVYNDMRRVDVTESAVVTGSLVIGASQIEHRHSAGTLTLTAAYGGFEASASVVVWQEEATRLAQYLTFNILGDGSVRFGSLNDDTAYTKTIFYSTDEGQTWNTMPSEINVTTGDKVIFKGENESYAVFSGDTPVDSFGFAGTDAAFEVEGNIMSLIYGDEFSGKNYFPEGSKGNLMSIFVECTGLTSAESLVLPATTLTRFCYGFFVSGMFRDCTSLTTAPELPATTLAYGCYFNMFGNCTSLTTAPELPTTILAEGCYANMFACCTSLTTAPELPANTLAVGCYSGMFSGCTGLASAPALTATTLADYCYSNMFHDCTSLTTTPELPATTLANYCYASMFWGCTSLTTAPELPATTLTSYCYDSMFNGCTSLTTAPELPATTLVDYCYHSMFYACTSLTTAPELPATTLAFWCYAYMFSGCTSLSYIKCLATDIRATNCTYSWIDDVASTGTFVKNPNMSSWGTGISGIPANWTVEDAQ